MLKAAHVIPPAVALVAMVVWNVSRWRSVTLQEEAVHSLRDRVEKAALSPKSTAMTLSGGRTSRKSKSLAASAGIDWKDLSGRLREIEENGGTGDLREMAALQKRIADMNRDELMAALNEISNLGLDAEGKSALEEMLVPSLIEKDPALALATFADRIKNDEDGVGWQLSSALGEWAKTDLAAATKWLDGQIAAGLFDSKSLDGQSQARMEFEASLVGVLLTSDPAAAEQRIAALPEDQRREALEQITFSELSPAGQKAYAALVRGLVPQDERAGSFTHVISELIPEGGYAKVGSFLDDIQATPEERVVSAREAANAQLGEIAGDRAVTKADVDAMRQWLETQAPGTADRVTGEALADAAQDGGEFDFAEASKLALQYHKSSGNDDVLVAFLESFAARSNLEKALPLAQMISDPKRRQQILDSLN